MLVKMTDIINVSIITCLIFAIVTFGVQFFQDTPDYKLAFDRTVFQAVVVISLWISLRYTKGIAK